MSVRRERATAPALASRPQRVERGAVSGSRIGCGERLDSPELMGLLRERLGHGADVRILATSELGSGVYRLRLALDGGHRSVVIKRSDPAMARRNRLVAQRWLPAAGLAESGPPLIGIAAERNGDHVWQLLEDLGDWILDESAPDRRSVEAAVELIARVHTSFAGHALLAECRLWGSDFGGHACAANVRDAIRALDQLRAAMPGLSVEEAALRDRLLGRLQELHAGEDARALMLARLGVRDTLLHGDLWPSNVLVHPTTRGMRARLIDWDRAGVGPITYDISAFLSRLPASERERVLESYRWWVGRAGWSLPDATTLNALFATAEYSRLANRIIWPAIAISHDHSHRAWAFAELAALEEWLAQVGPLLPAPSAGRARPSAT